MKSGLFFQAFFFSNPIIYSAQNSIIPPRLERIDAYNREIDSKEKALAALNKRQFELMLTNDAAGIDALDKDIAETEKQRDMLKSQLGQVMGADVRGHRGNQLTEGVSPLVYKMPDEEQKPYDFGMTVFENKSGAGYDDLVKPLSASVPKADKGMEDEEKSAVKPYKEDPFQGRHAYDEKGYAGGAFGGGGAGGAWGSESDSQLTELEKQLGMREKLASGYQRQLDAAMFNDPNYKLYQEGYVRNLEEAGSLKKQIDAWKEVTLIEKELPKLNYKDIPDEEWDDFLENLRGYQEELRGYYDSGYFTGIDGASERLEGVRDKVNEMINDMTQVEWDKNHTHAEYSDYLLNKIEQIGSDNATDFMTLVIDHASTRFPAGTTMLDRAMNGDGLPQVFDENDPVGMAVAADQYFTETVKERLEAGEWNDIPIAFAGNNDDLHFGIVKATANITYAEKKDNVWYADVTIDDTYNYDEWLDTDFSLPALSDFVDPIPYLKDIGIPMLNNCALSAQYYGSLKPYKVTVNVSLEIPAEEGDKYED